MSELIHYAATEIMGWEDQKEGYVGSGYVKVGYDSRTMKTWHPHEDSNQLDLIEAELVKLKMWIDITSSRHRFSIRVSAPDVWAIKHTCKHTLDQIRLTRLTAMVEAHQKLTQEG